MGEPLRVAARILSELPPFLQFLRTVCDRDLPSLGSGSGFEVPDPSFWRVAADSALRELRGEGATEDLEARKLHLRRLLQRAQSSRRALQRFTASDRHVDLPYGARIVNSRKLPPGVVEATRGLFLASTPDEAQEDGDVEPERTTQAELGAQVQADDTIVLRCRRGADEELWGLYRLFADRLVLLFDKGRTVLIVAPPWILSCLLYGLFLRCWQLPVFEASKHLKRLGRDQSDVPESFRQHLSESPGIFRLPCGPGERPPSAMLALRAHVRLLDESKSWPIQRAEPLIRATEALLARAVGWDPHAHEAASAGTVCLAMLTTIRRELSGASGRKLTTPLKELFSVSWKLGGRTTIEDGIILEPAEGVEGPADLAQELQQEFMRGATQLPKVLVVALEGTRPAIISESVVLGPQPQADNEASGKSGSCPRATYHTLAVAAGGIVVTRGNATWKPIRGSRSPALPGSRATADGSSLHVPRPPAVVVLVQEDVLSGLGQLASWTQLLNTCICGSTTVPRAVSERSRQDKTYKVRLVTLGHYDSACRSGRPSAWDEVESLCVVELGTDSKVSSLHAKAAKELKVPVEWLLLLSPGARPGHEPRSWRHLLPSARTLDHAVAPAGGGGPMILVLGILKDAAKHVSFPWMFAICHAWEDRQLVPLDVVLLDARRTLGSYSGRIARRIEEAVGPHAYCTAFTTYLLPPHDECDAGGATETSQAALTPPGSSWRPLKMGTPIAAELRPAEADGDGGSMHVHCIAWEALPLAPSTTGRGLLAAHDAACLPDLCAQEKKLPLERLTERKTEELGAVLLSGPGAMEVMRPLHLEDVTEAEEYAALLVLEERLLVAWINDACEAVHAVSAEARRRVDSMIARLRASSPDEPPPGLKEWPSEPTSQWNGRTWERVCRGTALAQGWMTPSPTATEAEVAQGLLWAEVATLQEIVLSLDAINMIRQGRMVLDGVRQSPSGTASVQVSHLGPRLGDVVEAERRHYTILLKSSELDHMFSLEVEDLPSECDFDIAGLHALVQTTNAELNALWNTQRAALLSGEDEQLWRVVRLREMALSAPFLLMKQTQGTKASDAFAVEWLQHVQQGCQLVLQKSMILCEAASAVAGPPAGGEEAIAVALEDLARELESVGTSLDKLHKERAAAPISDKGVDDSPKTEDADGKTLEAEQLLQACDLHTLSGNLLALALERQLEASSAPASTRVARGIRDVREGLHKLTPKAMLVRTTFNLPLLEDTVAMFANESQRRGRKLRLLGRNSRRSSASFAARLPSLALEPEADVAEQEAAEAAAEAQAVALLRSEDQARAKKDKDDKRRKQKSKKSALARSPRSPEEEKIQSVINRTASEIQEKPVQQVPREPEEEVAPDGDMTGAQQQRQAPPEEESVLLLLEKGPFELLSERRKARLLELERSSGAKCTLDSVGQAVRISGHATHVAEARQLIEDLCVEWVQVAEPVWAVLLRSRDRTSGHLNVLQAETQCSVVVDRSSSRVRVAGTAQQVECAQAWLWRMHEDCDTMQVWLGPHVKSSESLATEAQANSLEVHVDLQRQRGGGCIARVLGITWEVQRVVDLLRAAASQSPARTGSTAATPCAIELSDKSGRSSKSTSSSGGGRRGRESPLEVTTLDFGAEGGPGTQTPSDWGDAMSPVCCQAMQISEALQQHHEWQQYETSKRNSPKRTALQQEQQRQQHDVQQRGLHSPSHQQQQLQQQLQQLQHELHQQQALRSPQQQRRRELPQRELPEYGFPQPGALQPIVVWQVNPAGPPAEPFRCLEEQSQVFEHRLQPQQQQQPQERLQRYPSAPTAPIECGNNSGLAEDWLFRHRQPPLENRNNGGLPEGNSSDSLAELLAQQFPTARIIVGAPDEQQKTASEVQAEQPREGRLEMQMNKLKELLERDRARPVFR